MTTLKHGTLLFSFLIALSLDLGSAASAENRAFPSTSLESSQAWYSLQFNAGTGGTLDKFRLTFPAGMLGGSVGVGDLVIGTARPKAVASVDPLDPNRVVIDLATAKTITAGTKIILEVLGLTNPLAGDYQVGIELLGTTGTVLVTLAPIPFSIASLASGPGSGDITGVLAGTGLSGGGLSGDVTLAVDPTQIQKRVTGSCAVGNAVRVVKQDGTVTCEAVGGGAGGTVTSVGTGAGLTGGPITTTGTISVATGGITTALLANTAVTGAKLGANSVDSSKIIDGSIGSADVNTAQIQARVTGTCTAGNAIRAIDSVGGVACEATGGGGGGVTAVTASAPLVSSGGATPDISLPNVIIGGSDTAIGTGALSSNTTGVNNTASGVQALFSNTTGSFNTASGVDALFSNTTGVFNTASGVDALFSNTTGNNNTASGVSALSSNTTGVFNTAIGRSALANNTTGGDNTAVGTGADVSVGNLTNATAIGAGPSPRKAV